MTKPADLDLDAVTIAQATQIITTGVDDELAFGAAADLGCVLDTIEPEGEFLVTIGYRTFRVKVTLEAILGND